MMRTAKQAMTALLALLIAVTGSVLPITLSATPAGAYPATELTLTGHGYGHGRGMGQYGALGYATRHGWVWQQILDHFYGGTTLGSQPNADIGVRLVYQDGIDLTVTAGVPFTMGGVAIPAGGAGRFAMGQGGQVHLAVANGGCGTAETYAGVVPAGNEVVTSSVAEPYAAELGKMLTVCTPSVKRTYRGQLRMVSDNGVPRTVNVLKMEAYLRGVVPRESPASWATQAEGKGIHALNAQAVAARSYAWAEFRYPYAKTCDTESCQVYLGAGGNGQVLEHANTDQAIANTWQAVRRHTSNNTIARTEFSSSTGGHTAGGTFPAVADLGDEASPYHDWRVDIPVTTVQQAYPQIGTLESVVVLERNGLGADGGRVRRVVFRGSAGELERTGDQVRQAFALRSNWFSVVPPPTTPTPAPPSGSGRQWLVPATIPPGEALTKFSFGAPGDVPLSCDWNGDGVDSPGVFRNGVWAISNTQSNDPNGIATFSYGAAGDIPVCGDWNADRIDTVGVWRAGVFHLRNFNSAGPIGGSFRFGDPTDRPIVGDWNGDHSDTPGVHRGDRVFLANSYASLVTDQTYVFGGPNDRAIIGDWDGNRRDELGLQRGDRYYTSDGAGGLRHAFPFGIAADRGISGVFVAGGPDVIALVRG